MDSHNPGPSSSESKEIIPQDKPLVVRLLNTLLQIPQVFLKTSASKKRRAGEVESASSPHEQSIAKRHESTQASTTSDVIVKVMRIPYELHDKAKCDLIFEAIDPKSLTAAKSGLEEKKSVVALAKGTALGEHKLNEELHVQAHSFILKGISKLVATHLAFPSAVEKPPYKFDVLAKNKNNLFLLIKLAYSFDPTEIDKLKLDEDFIEIIHMSGYLLMDDLIKLLLLHLEKLLKQATLEELANYHSLILAYEILVSGFTVSESLARAKDIFESYIKNLPPSVFEEDILLVHVEAFVAFMKLANLIAHMKLEAIQRYADHPSRQTTQICALKLSLIEKLINLDEIIPGCNYDAAYRLLVTQMKIIDPDTIIKLKQLIKEHICNPPISNPHSAWPYGSYTIYNPMSAGKISFDIKISLNPSAYSEAVLSHNKKQYTTTSPEAMLVMIDRQRIPFHFSATVIEDFYFDDDLEKNTYLKSCTLSYFFSCDVSDLPFATHLTGELKSSVIQAKNLKKIAPLNNHVKFFRDAEEKTQSAGECYVPLIENMVHIDSDGSRFAWVHAELSNLKLKHN